MGTLMFMVGGYDDDPREIHTVPEIRQFYKRLHEAWPYWLCFCNLETELLRSMVMCCLASIAAIKMDGQPNVGVEYKPLELLNFVSTDFGPMNEMCDRAEMAERLIYDQSKAVF